MGNEQNLEFGFLVTGANLGAHYCCNELTVTGVVT